MLNNDRIKSFLTYAGKCVAATLTVYILSSWLDYKDMAWSLISVILVLSPDGKDAVSLAFTRIKANVVGAGVGLLFLLISPTNMWMMSAALAVTMFLCYLLRFDTAVRSALAATVIIMLHEEGKHIWNTAAERVIAVMAGCALGLIITFIFHFKAKGREKKVGDHQEA